MGKELSRRDFLKAAALGLGAAFLAACSKNKNERCNDPQHSVTLRPGDYVNVGNIEFKIITYGSNYGDDFAVFKFEDRQGNEIPHEPSKFNQINTTWTVERMVVGEALRFDIDPETGNYRRIVYYCNHNTFAFWEFSEFPTMAPTIKPTQVIPTPTRTPVAIFP